MSNNDYEEEEKPVRIIKHDDREHKTETRIFRRDIHESFCNEPDCKFYGDHAVQGVCHTKKTFTDLDDWSYIDNVIDSAEKFGEEVITNLKNQFKGDEYIERLESEIVVHWMNSITQLDELVRLRKENASLKKKLEEK